MDGIYRLAEIDMDCVNMFLPYHITYWLSIRYDLSHDTMEILIDSVAKYYYI